MKEYVKTFNELTLDQLFNIAKLREDVFIVEQGCPFPELDEKDKQCAHVFIEDESGVLMAYSRVYEDEDKEGTVIIGRVIAAQRGCGMGKNVMDLAIGVAKDIFHAKIIKLRGQVVVKPFYEKFGFVACSEEFMHEGRMHVDMELICNKSS